MDNVEVSCVTTPSRCSSAVSCIEMVPSKQVARHWCRDSVTIPVLSLEPAGRWGFLYSTPTHFLVLIQFFIHLLVSE